MIQISMFAQIPACCWSSFSCIYDTEPTLLVPSLSLSSPSSVSITLSIPMVKRRSKRANYCSRPINQLVKQVSPFEELPVSDERYTFDENPFQCGPIVDERHDVEKRDAGGIRHDDVRDTRVSQRDSSNFADSAGGFPNLIVVPKKSDDCSEVTLEEALFKEEEYERPLTPHPSFDEHDNKPTVFDFHYLYTASLEVDEQDWPSDEDGAISGQDGCSFWPKGRVHKRNLGHDVMMIMKDVDDGLSKKISQSTEYRLA